MSDSLNGLLNKMLKVFHFSCQSNSVVTLVLEDICWVSPCLGSAGFSTSVIRKSHSNKKPSAACVCYVSAGKHSHKTNPWAFPASCSQTDSTSSCYLCWTRQTTSNLWCLSFKNLGLAKSPPQKNSTSKIEILFNQIMTLTKWCLDCCLALVQWLDKKRQLGLWCTLSL